MKCSIKLLLLLVLALVFTFPKITFATNPTNPIDANTIVFVLAWEGFKNPKRVAAAKQKNERIKKAASKFWEEGMDCKFMIEKEAYKYARKNKGTIVGEFVTKLSTQGGEGTFDIREGNTKKILSVRLPFNKLDHADLAYAMMHGQFMLRNLNTFKKPTKELPQKYGHLLKQKTLLVSEENLSKRFTADDLAKAYPHKVKVVSFEELNEAILTKDDRYLVLYEASEGGNVTTGTYPYWNIYQPSDGVVVARHAGNVKGLSEVDINLFIKRTSK